MTVHDLWSGLTKAEIAERRAGNRDRWQRRWREGVGRGAKQRKQSYKEAQKAQAYLDDAAQLASPKATRLRRDSITVATLLDRHLAAKSDRAPKTLEADRHHADAVREFVGDRLVSTLDATEIEVWSQRSGVARSSRKKQVEILRAAIKRGMRDRYVDHDPTDGIVVSLGHRELAYWTSSELMAVINAAETTFDKALLGVLGLMGPRSGEVRSLRVRDLTITGSAGRLRVTNSGAGTDTTKTRAGRRDLPVPETVLPWLVDLTDGRPKEAPLFESPRKPGQPVGKRYLGDAVTRAVTRANASRQDPIRRISVHGLRHTYAAIALSEVEASVLSVSKALGHAKPSVTLNEYGHLAPAALDLLTSRIDELVTPLVEKDVP